MLLTVTAMKYGSLNIEVMSPLHELALMIQTQAMTQKN